MSNDPNAGGDISSGFGDSEVKGPVSDEKAEQMLHSGPPSEGGEQASGQGAGDYSESDQATNEQDLTQDQ